MGLFTTLKQWALLMWVCVDYITDILASLQLISGLDCGGVDGATIEVQKYGIALMICSSAGFLLGLYRQYLAIIRRMNPAEAPCKVGVTTSLKLLFEDVPSIVVVVVMAFYVGEVTVIQYIAMIVSL